MTNLRDIAIKLGRISKDLHDELEKCDNDTQRGDLIDVADSVYAASREVDRLNQSVWYGRDCSCCGDSSCCGCSKCAACPLRGHHK